MGELSASLLKSFGIRAGRVVKEKSYFVCDTPDGLLKLAKTRVNEERILFEHDIKEHMAHTGYPWVEQYILTPDGAPYLRNGGDCYVLTPYYERNEPDFSSWPDFARVIDSVARWHGCARGVVFKQNTRVITPSAPLNQIFARQTAEMNGIRKRVGKQARLSDFDVLFIKNASYYARLMNEAAEALAKTDYPERFATAVDENHICHNALKEESISFGSEAVYITQYADACVDIQLHDLCALIRRHIKCAGANAAPIAQILDIYSHTEPVTQAASDVLHAMLLYPYPFMKIVTQYYSKKRSWTPNALTLRMQSVVNEKENYERHITF